MHTDVQNQLSQALLREEMGDVLREYRQRQGRTLREVSSDARVSLGYLSEVERGQKEASSELLESIAKALNVPLSHVLRLVADRMDIAAGRPTPAMRRAALQRRILADGVPGEHAFMLQEIPDAVPAALIERELLALSS